MKFFSLRKSHENLAGTMSAEMQMTPLSSFMSRSRSIGNLRFSTPFSMNGQRSEIFESRTAADTSANGRELSDSGKKYVFCF